MKKKLLLIIGIVLLVLALAVLAVVGYLTPYLSAETVMNPAATLVLTRQEDGSTVLSWPQDPFVERYYVEVLQEESVLFQQHVESGTQCALPQLPLSQELTVRVNSVGTYRFPFEKTLRLRKGDAPLEFTGILELPAVKDLLRTDDPEKGTVQLRFDLEDNMTCQLYQVQEQTLRQLQSTDQEELRICFGPEEAFPLPAHGEELTFALSCTKRLQGMELRGAADTRITVCREDLLGTDLKLEATDKGSNRYILHWNETKGDHFLLQLWNQKTRTWGTVQEFSPSEPLEYDTGYLPRYTEFIYRVQGVGGQTLPDSAYSTEPSEVTLTTGASVVYSTVWPIQKLDVYSTPDKKEVIGSVPEAKAFCVTAVEDNMFLIRYQGEKLGYVDGNYCMVNLPEYMGDKCIYNISNSFESRYMIHNYAIDEVTDKVVVGYEDVRLENKDFLVPLLYPTAQKLEQAALAAIKIGYKLMIYDSYRPRKATIDLYTRATELLDKPLPAVDYDKKPGVNANLTGAAGETPVTYAMLMTDNGRYNLNYFLANGGSRHNQGIALDLTMVKISKGEEVKMQSAIHDLSWYSETKQNNDAAWTLSNLMTKAGLVGLVSEWWHFQDDEALKELKLTNFMREGVTANCWMADATGWRYRRTNGRYLTNCTVTVDGIAYRFDAKGYATAVQN